jgi:hypothetical protein
VQPILFWLNGENDERSMAWGCYLTYNLRAAEEGLGKEAKAFGLLSN